MRKRSAHMEALEAIREDARQKMAGMMTSGGQSEPAKADAYEGGKRPAVTIVVGHDEPDEDDDY